jgi:hypothetical protein
VEKTIIKCKTKLHLACNIQTEEKQRKKHLRTPEEITHYLRGKEMYKNHTSLSLETTQTIKK